MELVDFQKGRLYGGEATSFWRHFLVGVEFDILVRDCDPHARAADTQLDVATTRVWLATIDGLAKKVGQI